MSYGVRKQNVPYEREEHIISCCECGMQFILNGVVVGEEGNIITMQQVQIDFCPYCGYAHKQPEDELSKALKLEKGQSFKGEYGTITLTDIEME